jgi:molybdate transport system substrate-binding protein
MRLRAGLVLLACVSAMLAACTGGGPAQMSGTLTVFASPAMTEAMAGMARAYSGTYPGVRFDTIFEPDSELARRAAQGPSPDLIVAEDPATLVAAGATGTPVHFARGQLVLAVPQQNPARVVQLADLARPGVRVALCDAAQPCGRVAETVLAVSNVALGEGTLREPDVRAALRHVTDGSADVALVYRSDAQAARDAVLTIEVPNSGAALADFVAIVPDGAPNPGLAKAFLDYLGSAPVREAFTREGFAPAA